MRAGVDRPRSSFAYALRLFRANQVRWAWFHAALYVWRTR